MFEIGMEVRIKKHFETISSSINIDKNMLIYRGKLTKIKNIWTSGGNTEVATLTIDKGSWATEVATLTIDKGSWAWDLNWLEFLQVRTIKEI